MPQIHRFVTQVGDKKLILEAGKFAGQANAAVTAQYGDTLVLASVVMGKSETKLPYFPLMVDYEERLYAAGKIKGSRFIKREGKPSDEAVLTGRLVDRSIRPLFDIRLKRDVQVVITVLSIDKVNDPDFPALVATSAALSISDIPWDGPVAAATVGCDAAGNWYSNPSQEQKILNEFNIFVAGKDDQVIMIEADGKEAPEARAEEAIERAAAEIQPLTKFIRDIQGKIGKEKAPVEEVSQETAKERERAEKKINALINGRFGEVMNLTDKAMRNRKIDGIVDEVVAKLAEETPETSVAILGYAKEKAAENMELQARKYVVDEGLRVDGRKPEELREITSEVGLIPRAHGSGLFHRGETQVLSVLTLGAPGDKQVLDSMELEGEKDYMHHYNFPGYSVGEPKPLRGPGRREIGHGALAEKALIPVLPKDKEKFPYTIRVVSETLSSNGSSSQASVCGSSLALMDAGVPISAPVAGIAIGMMSDAASGKYRILTDIQGIEDHAGDMGFKIAGTRKGITAIQLDIKLGGISVQVCREALAAGRQAREKILDNMEVTLAAPRAELSPYAPRIESLRVDPDRIREIIGPGGKMINEIIDATDVDIDIEDDGLVMVTSTDAEMMKKAKDWILSIVKTIEVGEVYEGEAVQFIKDRNTGAEIGVIVKITPTKDGMVHISEVAPECIARISDVIKLGDTVKVKVMDVVNVTGRIGLSRRALLPGGGGPRQDNRRGPGGRGDHRGGPGKFRDMFHRKRE